MFDLPNADRTVRMGRDRERKHPWCQNRSPECPLLAISGHTEGCARTSALPPKADIHGAIPRRRLPSLVETLFGVKSPGQLAWLIIGLAHPRKNSLSKPRSLTRGRLQFTLGCLMDLSAPVAEPFVKCLHRSYASEGPYFGQGSRAISPMHHAVAVRTEHRKILLRVQGNWSVFG